MRFRTWVQRRRQGREDLPPDQHVCPHSGGSSEGSHCPSELGDDVPEGKHLSPRAASGVLNLKRRERADFNVNGSRLPSQIKLFNCDFREVGKRIKDETADLIFIDPPFGVEFLPLWDDLGRLPQGFLSRGRCS